MKILKILVNDLKRIKDYHVSGMSALPFNVLIEINNSCNLSCAMCPRRKMTRKVENMPLSTFKHIIDQIAEFGTVSEIGLNLFGEPLMCPTLFEMIKYAKSKGIRSVMLSTNATLLTKETGKKLIESGVNFITIDMDGFKKETYESLRIGAKYETVLKNVLDFAETLKHSKEKPMVYLQIIKMKSNEAEIKDWLEYWKNKPFNLIVKQFNAWADQHKDITNMSSDISHRKRYPCELLWSQMMICVNGDVIPCCCDYDATIKLGNVNNTSLRDIWFGDKYKSIRKMHKDRNYRGICSNCNEWVGYGISGIWRDLVFLKQTRLWWYLYNKRAKVVNK